MKRFMIVVLVLAVIGVGFYFGYYRGKSSSAAISSTEGKAPVNNPIPSAGQSSPRDTAVNFFQDCAAGDWDKVFTYCPPLTDKQKDALKEYLDGMEIINIGQPFKKLTAYAGLYIPYEIKLKSGEIRKGNMAVRNDNPAKVWMFDGGI
jgi:hypothetical protein